MVLSKGIIYYSNGIGEPIGSIVREHIAASGLPIVSCTMEPLDFGENHSTHGGEPSIAMLWWQIKMALQHSRAENVFFCEHDVLYPPSHFNFVPPKKDVFYYNSHVWRWDYPKDHLVTYDRLISLSGLCCNRELAWDQFDLRLIEADERGYDMKQRDPGWARRWGYEPGTKKRRRGGFSDQEFETWRSDEPLIDIRHEHTFSPRKTTLESFKHQPTGWRDAKLDDIPNWNLMEMFGCLV